MIPKTCCRALAVAFALSLLSPALVADTYWRWTSDGGTSWTSVDSSTFSPPAFTGSTAEDNIVEFVQDCTYGQSGGYTLATSATFRSQPGVGVRTLRNTVQGRGSLIYVKNESAAISLVVSNLTVHGGAEWKSETLSDFSTTDNNYGSGFCTLCYGATFELGFGGTLRNFRSKGDWCLGVINVDDYRGSKIYLKPGSLITESRAEGATVHLGNSTATTFYMSGGEISRCYASFYWAVGGIVATYNNYKSHMYLSGGKIINNEVSTRAAVNTGYYHLSGDMVIKDNLCSGSQANVLPTAATDVILEDDLTSNASIGISYPSSLAVDAQFGKASSADLAGAKYFFADADPYEWEGAVTEDKKLVWKVPVLETLVFTASDVCADADGLAHTIPLTVTTPSSGATIVWSTSKTGTYTSEKPSFTEPGVYSVWYRISASGYRVVQGGKLVVLNDPTESTVGYRLKNDGGAWLDVRKTAFTTPPFAGTAPELNVVEFVSDCTCSDTTEYVQPCTLRSAAGSVRKLATTFSSNVGILSEMVISNLVIDGGANFKNPTDLTDVSCSGLSYRTLYRLPTGSSLTLGSGTVITNFSIGDNHGLIKLELGTCTMLDGARVVDCRGRSSVLGFGSGYESTFIMRGGEITRCYNSIGKSGYAGLGIVGDTTYSMSGQIELRGGSIHDNIVESKGAVTIYHTESGAKLLVSGSPRVYDNFFSDGTIANVYLADANRLTMDGSLTASASVGITLPTTAAVGGSFGKVSEDGLTGAGQFFADSDPYGLAGTTDGLSLVWEVPVLDDIVVSASDVCAETNGAAHTIPLTVTTPSSGATVLWAMSANGPYTSEKPSFTEPGVYAVWYRISASGYRTLQGGKMVVLNDPTETTVGYRLKNDGGAWMNVRKTDFTTPPFTGDTPESNVAEFLTDCTCSDMTEYAQPCTLRSAAGTLRKLSTSFTKSTAVDLQSDTVVSNLVFDGGANFKKPNPSNLADLTDTSCTGLYYRALFAVQLHGSLTLGAGAVLTNYYVGDTLGIEVVAKPSDVELTGG